MTTRPEDDLGLDGRVAIVTGGGAADDGIGNGRAAAILFAREGARVVVVDRDLARARDTDAAIRAEGGAATSIEADVTREADCMRLARTVVETHGRIDVLHNNVGIGGGDAGATALEEDVWDRIMTVNVKGLFLACKHVVPVMRAQMSGSIVNISSIAAVCSVGIIAYKSSKAAVNAFSHSLALGNARIDGFLRRPGVGAPAVLRRRALNDSTVRRTRLNTRRVPASGST